MPPGITRTRFYEPKQPQVSRYPRGTTRPIRATRSYNDFVITIFQGGDRYSPLTRQSNFPRNCRSRTRPSSPPSLIDSLSAAHRRIKITFPLEEKGGGDGRGGKKESILLQFNDYFPSMGKGWSVIYESGTMIHASTPKDPAPADRLEITEIKFFVGREGRRRREKKKERKRERERRKKEERGRIVRGEEEIFACKFYPRLLCQLFRGVVPRKG